MLQGAERESGFGLHPQGRAVEQYQAREWAYLVERDLRGDHHAPIVGQQQRLFRPRSVDERRNVVDQMLEGVLSHSPWLVGLTEAAQVRCPNPVAEGGQQRELMSPRVADLRKAVEAERELVAVGDDPSDVVVSLLQASEASNGDLVTVYWGEPVSAESAASARDRVLSEFPGTEVELVRGGQSNYHYIISVE